MFVCCLLLVRFYICMITEFMNHMLMNRILPRCSYINLNFIIDVKELFYKLLLYDLYVELYIDNHFIIVHTSLSSHLYIFSSLFSCRQKALVLMFVSV